MISVSAPTGIQQRKPSPPDLGLLANRRRRAFRGKFSVGVLVPSLLLVCALLDIGLRLAPLDWLRLFPYQRATRWPGHYSPFIPNLRLVDERPVGELALMANFQPSELRAPVTFSTDALGFRSTPLIANPSPPGILLMEGDSFTFGAGLSDHDTLSAVLSRRLRTDVYNGGRFYTDPERLKDLDWLIPRLPFRPSLVLFILLDPVDLNWKLDYGPRSFQHIGERILGENRFAMLFDEARFVRRRLNLWWGISPLRILATRAYKMLCNDSLLPNEYRDRVEEFRLPDGRRFLAERKHVDRYLNPPDDSSVRQTADYLASLAHEFQKRGYGFEVVMVPEAISVYGDWLIPHARRSREHQFSRLEQLLMERKIPALNALLPLRAAAPRDIAEGRLSYYLEDHHWNPQGVERVVDAIARSQTTSE